MCLCCFIIQKTKKRHKNNGKCPFIVRMCFCRMKDQVLCNLSGWWGVTVERENLLGSTPHLLSTSSNFEIPKLLLNPTIPLSPSHVHSSHPFTVILLTTFITTLLVYSQFSPPLSSALLAPPLNSLLGIILFNWLRTSLLVKDGNG